MGVTETAEGHRYDIYPPALFYIFYVQHRIMNIISPLEMSV